MQEDDGGRRASDVSLPGASSLFGARACAQCGDDVQSQAQLAGVARLVCACWLCLACLSSWLAAAMDAGAAPACPHCKGASHEGYNLHAPSKSPGWVGFSGFQARLLPPWHQKYMVAGDAPRESSVAITLSRPGGHGPVHIGGIYSTAAGVPECSGRKRRDFLDVVHVLGRIAHHYDGGRRHGVPVDGLEDAMDAALGDKSLMHQAFACFMTGTVQFRQDGFLVPVVKADALRSHRVARELYGAWAACEISRKIHDVWRVGGLQGLVTQLLQNPGEDRALGALMKMGLAMSYASVSAEQVRQCRSGCRVRELRVLCVCCARALCCVVRRALYALCCAPRPLTRVCFWTSAVSWQRLTLAECLTAASPRSPPAHIRT